jgi:arginase
MTLAHATLRPGHLESMRSFSLPNGSGVISSENVVLFGLSTASPANKRHHMGYLFDENLRVVTADVVARNPVGRAKQALEWLGERVDHILVHLDVDVIDPGQFPLGNVPSWTGFGFEEVMGALGVFFEG